MAMIECAECGKRISSTAKKCPGCGYRRAEVNTAIGCSLMAGGLSVVLVLMGPSSETPYTSGLYILLITVAVLGIGLPVARLKKWI